MAQKCFKQVGNNALAYRKWLQLQEGRWIAEEQGRKGAWYLSGCHRSEEQKSVEKTYKTKNWFFENINKVEKLLVGLAKKKEMIQMTNIRNEKGILGTDPLGSKRILWATLCPQIL